MVSPNGIPYTYIDEIFVVVSTCIDFLCPIDISLINKYNAVKQQSLVAGEILVKVRILC
jgi:hypothetical protein